MFPFSLDDLSAVATTVIDACVLLRSGVELSTDPHPSPSASCLPPDKCPIPSVSSAFAYVPHKIDLDDGPWPAERCVGALRAAGDYSLVATG